MKYKVIILEETEVSVPQVEGYLQPITKTEQNPISVVESDDPDVVAGFLRAAAHKLSPKKNASVRVTSRR